MYQPVIGQENGFKSNGYQIKFRPGQQRNNLSTNTCFAIIKLNYEIQQYLLKVIMHNTRN